VRHKTRQTQLNRSVATILEKKKSSQPAAVGALGDSVTTLNESCSIARIAPKCASIREGSNGERHHPLGFQNALCNSSSATPGRRAVPLLAASFLFVINVKKCQVQPGQAENALPLEQLGPLITLRAP
jgi:hypothetical protein